MIYRFYWEWAWTWVYEDIPLSAGYLASYVRRLRPSCIERVR